MPIPKTRAKGLTMTMKNLWCEQLDIAPPKLADLVRHREANNYSLLIVALLESGVPMTLVEVAARFEEVGLADYDSALLSLKRCKPARAPVFRVDDHYHLDPQDRELNYWISRFELRPRPAEAVVEAPVPTPRTALPGNDVPLTLAELEEAWADASLSGWTAKKVALAILDAHGRAPMAPEDVVAVVEQHAQWHSLRVDSPHFGKAGSGIAVGADGRWRPADDAMPTLMRVRDDLRTMILRVRDRALRFGSPVDHAARRETNEIADAQRKKARAKKSRAVLAAFPPNAPEVVSVVDVGAHTVTTYFAEAFGALLAQLEGFDIIAAENIRPTLRALGFEQGERQLVDLGVIQKTTGINKRGDKLKITMALVIQGTCGISNPCGDPKKMAAYLAAGDRGKLQRRLEADVKALAALYEYGRSHNYLRLRWGFINETIEAPWRDFDEVTLHALVTSAGELGFGLECVVGSAPGWADPWARARLFAVEKEQGGYGWSVIDADGFEVDRVDIQLARVCRGSSEGRA